MFKRFKKKEKIMMSNIKKNLTKVEAVILKKPITKKKIILKQQSKKIGI